MHINRYQQDSKRKKEVRETWTDIRCIRDRPSQHATSLPGTDVREGRYFMFKDCLLSYGALKLAARSFLYVTYARPMLHACSMQLALCSSACI